MILRDTLKRLFNGVHNPRRTTFITAAAAMALAGSASAQHLIGLKMGMGGGGNQQGTFAGALLPTDSAGAPAYVQVNWNVLGRYGNNETNVVTVTNADNSITVYATNSFALLDSAGDDTHLTINWDATGNYGQAGGGTPTAQGSPDGNLMNGYCDSGGNINVALTNALSNRIYSQNNNSKPLVFIAGLQAWLASEGASKYDVVLYGDGDSTQGRTWEYWLQNAYNGPTTGPLTNLIFGDDLTTHAFMCDRANFVSTFSYVEIPLASPASWEPTFPQQGGGNAGWGATIGNNPGNFVVFPGLSADSFVLRTEEFRAAGSTLRSPINAIQIVPRTTPAPPTIGPLASCQVYAGGTAKFRAWVGGMLPLTYQWQKNGSPLSDGGKIAGSSTATLSISGVTSADLGNYTVVVSNANGFSSVTAPLTVATYAGNSFAEEIATNVPYAYWRFNDPDQPFTNNAVAHDYFGGFNGIYGLAAQNGSGSVAGPQSPAFPGFEADNSALQTANGTLNSWVIAPPLHLNTNTATMCAWIYPTAATEPANCGIVFSRTTIAGAATTGQTDQSGLNYYASGVPNSLGYTWNGQAATYNFQSLLTIPSNQWSFVGVIISPTNAILFVYNTNSLLSATNAVTNAVVACNGFTTIGTDPSGVIGGTPAGRVFTGMIDEVAVFNRSLPLLEIYNLYRKGLHLSVVPPTIATQPVRLALYSGQTARFTVKASGSPFLTFNYQWQRNTGPGPVYLVNGGNISGANSATLVITNVSAADLAAYSVVVVNLDGSTSSGAATLTVVPPPATLSSYEAALQALNPLDYWRLNETAGTTAHDYWGGNIATHVNGVIVAQPGPQPPGYGGLETNNLSAHYDGGLAGDSFTDTGLIGLNNNQTQFSIAGWFNTDGQEPLRVGLFGQNDVTEFGFHGADASGAAQLGIWTPSGAAYLPQSLITPGQWYFVAAIGDGQNVNLYLFSTNGGGGYLINQATSPSVTTNYGFSGYAFHIGGGGVLDPSGNNFIGLIDEVAVWHRAVSAGELASLFAAGIGLPGLAPQITAQSASQVIYAGRTARFSVTAVGSSPLTYQWRVGGVPVSDAGNVSGSATATLTITNAAAANIGQYDVVIANSFGSITSSVVSLGVITPKPGSYEATVIALNPLAYYRLNETSGTNAYDYVGGFTGAYYPAAVMGVPGPQGSGFLGFESTNTAVQVTATPATPGSYVTARFGSLSANTVTMAMWINPSGVVGTDFDVNAGLLVNRNSGVAGGFNYAGGNIGYTWNNNSANTYNFRSGFVPPAGQWSFVGVVVSPANAVIYYGNPPNALQAATNVLAHTSDVFGNNWQIGRDNNANLDNGTRNFGGSIDEVTVFTKSLTFGQMQQLYAVGQNSITTLTITQVGTNVVLTWPRGKLLEAASLAGPWTTNAAATSPYTTSPAGAQKFYRAQVR